MSASSNESWARSAGRQAQGVHDRLRKAVDEGRAADALAHLVRIDALAETHACAEVAQWQVTARGALGPIAGTGGVPGLAELADRVEALSEPWSDANLDGFMDVFQDSRHAALHGLMHAAARAGDCDLALDLFRRGDAGNVRVFARWERHGIPGSPGIHAVYPSAYAATQMIPHLIAARRYDAVPALLDRLQELTLFALGVPDEVYGEFHDAFGDEEAEAIATLLADGALPEALRERCRNRQDELARMAQPPEAWPRTWSRLSRVRLVV